MLQNLLLAELRMNESMHYSTCCPFTGPAWEQARYHELCSLDAIAARSRYYTAKHATAA